MTEDRLLAVKNATCEAIDHLHRSLESCPGAEAESPDPRGLKVQMPQSGDELVPVTRLLSCCLCLTLVCSDWLLRCRSWPIRGEPWRGCCGEKLKNPVEAFLVSPPHS